MVVDWSCINPTVESVVAVACSPVAVFPLVIPCSFKCIYVLIILLKY